MFTKFLLLFLLTYLLKCYPNSRNLQITCPSNCQTCTSETYCTSCINPNYKLVGKIQNYANDEVYCKQITPTNGYYLATNVYYPCINNCTSCTNQLTCDTCALGFELRYNGYKCETLIEGCKEFTSNTVCKKCEDTYVYYKNNKDKCYKFYIYDNTRYYTLDGGESFYPCSEKITGCYECSVTNTISICTKCQQNYAFKDDERNKCYQISTELTTAQGYYREDDQHYRTCSKIISHCSQCTGTNNCIKCDTNYYLINYNRAECFAYNTIGISSKEYYLDGNVYYTCNLNGGVENCKKCESKTTCNECYNNLIFIDGDYSKCVFASDYDLSKYFSSGTNMYKNCLQYSSIPNCEYCSSDTTCNKCKSGYAFIDDRHLICFQISALSNEYYKVDDTNYRPCSTAMNYCNTCLSKDHCLTCSGNKIIIDSDLSTCVEYSSVIDPINNGIIVRWDGQLYRHCSNIFKNCVTCINNQACRDCDSNYCLYNGNCKNYLELDNKQYYDNSRYCYDCSYRLSNCLLCTDGQTCIKCKSGYSVIQPLSSCDSTSTYSSLSEYYTPDNNINFYTCANDLESHSIPNCEKCRYENEINQCIECKSGYGILDDDLSGCISKSTFLDQQVTGKYIYTTDNKNYYTCNKKINNCLTCTSAINCLTCENDYAFYNNDFTKCLHKDNFIEGYYSNPTNTIYYKCISNCKTCTDRTYCDECKEGYELNDFKEKCDKILNNDEEIEENCIYGIKEITDNSVPDIPIITGLIAQYHTNYKNEKHYILKYINNKANYSVIIFRSDECSLKYMEDFGFYYNLTGLVTELKKTYSDSKYIIKCILLYKNQTSLTLYNNENLAKIDIKNLCPICYNKKYIIKYNFENNMNSQIGEKYTKMLSDKNADIFSEKSEIFENSCEDLSISGIDIPFEQRKKLFYKGNSTTNNNIFSCNTNCTLIRSDIKSFTSECQCEINEDITSFVSNAKNYEKANANINNETNGNSTNTTSKNSLYTFTCTSNGFKSENIKKNAGFYTVTFSLAIEIGSFIGLLTSLKFVSYAQLLVLNPPPKNKINNEEEKNNDDKINNSKKNKKYVKLGENDYYITGEENKNDSPLTQSRFKTKNYNTEENMNQYAQNGEIKHQRLNIYNNNYVTPPKIFFRPQKQTEKRNENKIDVFSEKSNSEIECYPIIKYIEYDINVYRDLGYAYEQKELMHLSKRYKRVKVIQYNLLNQNEKTKLIPLVFKNLLIDHLPFKYAVYCDKRTFCIFYYYLFCLKQPLINLFVADTKKEIGKSFLPFSLKLIKIVFMGISILFFNSIFINANYIKDKFNYFDEKFNFSSMGKDDKISSSEKISYSIQHSFLRAIFAFIIILIIDIILTSVISLRRRIKNLLNKYFEIDSGKIKNISQHEKEKMSFEKDMVKITDTKCVNIWVTVLLNAFLVIFYIYVTNFCSVYKGVSSDLFFSGFITFLIYLIFPIFSTFIITIFRILSLKSKNECLYNMSKTLMEI